MIAYFYRKSIVSSVTNLIGCRTIQNSRKYSFCLWFSQLFNDSEIVIHRARKSLSQNEMVCVCGQEHASHSTSIPFGSFHPFETWKLDSNMVLSDQALSSIVHSKRVSILLNFWETKLGLQTNPSAYPCRKQHLKLIFTTVVTQHKRWNKMAPTDIHLFKHIPTLNP